MMLERLNKVEVCPLTFGETVLTIELKLGGDDRVLSPAMHVNGSLRENESTGISDSRLVSRVLIFNIGSIVCTPSSSLVDFCCSTADRNRSSVNKQSTTKSAFGNTDKILRILPNRIRAGKGRNGIGKGIYGISIVERLGTECLPKKVLRSIEGGAVINMLVGLNDPNKLLARMVKVELDLVGSGTDRFISGELELFDEVLVGVLGHTSALIGIEEDVIDVEGCGDEGLTVCSGNLLTSRFKSIDGPKAFINGAEIEVNLDLVVLEGNEGKGETGVTAEPELEGNVEGGFGKGIARGASLVLDTRVGARTIDIGKVGVGEVGELSGVPNHLVVPALLLLGEGELVPDVHPVTILAVNALTTNLNLNLIDDLLSGEIEPPGIDVAVSIEALANLRESDLEVSPVGEISVPAYGAGNPAPEISLTVEGLLNGLHGEVGVTTVRHLPESDLGVSCKVDILCAVSY